MRAIGLHKHLLLNQATVRHQIQHFVVFASLLANGKRKHAHSLDGFVDTHRQIPIGAVLLQIIALTSSAVQKSLFANVRVEPPNADGGVPKARIHRTSR